jgi:hypothetical protein
MAKKDIILSYISEESIFVFTIIFWYLLFTKGIQFDRAIDSNDIIMFPIGFLLCFCFFSIISLISSTFNFLTKPQKSRYKAFIIVNIFIFILSFVLGFPILLFRAKGLDFTLIILGGIFTIIVVTNAFVRDILNKKLKFALYVWYLIIIILIAMWNYNFNDIFLIIQEKPTLGNNPLVFILTGMTTLYFVANIFYIIQLMPSQGKHESFKSMLDRLQENYDEIVIRFSDHHVSKLGMLAIILVEIAIFGWNYYFKILAPELLVFLWLIIFPNLLLLIRQFISLSRTIVSSQRQI